MPSQRTKQSTAARPTPKRAPSREHEVEAVVAELRRLATKRTLDGMARYGLPSDKALGVAVGDLQKLAKRLGRNHELAAALWDTAWYEARMLASFVDDPACVTVAQMERWCRDFDNWGICDTVCFHLFDRTPHAWRKYKPWSRRREEFVKRAGFVLMACLAGHDRSTSDEPFLAMLPLIEQGAHDERNFVKKGVNWALRRVGERSAALHAAALVLAKRLSQSESAACRWVGKDALRELASPKVRSRLARRAK